MSAFLDRDYQTLAHTSIFEAWLNHRSTLLVLATGLGKTIVAARIIKAVQPGRVLVLAHRDELISQAKDKIESVTGLSVEVEKANLCASTSLFHRMPVVVSSIQTQISGPVGKRRYLRFKPEDFALVICDECFVAGTIVDGRPIETIRQFDSVTTHQGVGTVTHLFKKKAGALCRLKFSDGRELVCTLNHPVWTPDGYFCAAALTPGDVVLTITQYEEMHHLSAASKKQTLRKQQVSVGVLEAHDSKLVQEAWRGDNKVQENQRNARPGSSGARLNETEGDGLEANSEAWKRIPSNDSATGFGIGSRVGDGSWDSDTAIKSQWLSKLLQGGHWKSRSENGSGGGREFSLRLVAPETGLEERRTASFARLVSREILEPGSGGEFERLCPDGFVYNLEVSNGNTYVANGVLVHNCHHAVSKSWREVISHYQNNPDLKLLGLTATPDRSDEKALGQVFESVALSYGILDAIRDGWLVDITQQFVPVSGLDFSHVRTTAGDLNEGDLSKVMESEENIQGVCQPSLEVMFGLAPKTLSVIPVPRWREYLAGLNRVPRRTIIFTVSVAQAEMCANVFSRSIDGVEWVCGKTNKDKRRAILDRFTNGETHAVVNCGVLLEGFDNPAVEVIVMARPTKSRALYAQAIGRSTRTLPGVVDGLETAEERRAAIAGSPKKWCRILDFVGNSGQHKLISCADVLGGKICDAARENAKAKAIREGKPVRIMVTMDLAEIELRRKQEEAAENARREREARKNHLVAKVNFELQDVSAFSNGHERIVFTPTKSRDGRTFSEKQTAVLRNNGHDPARYNYNQGQAIIGKIKAGEHSMPATPKQKAFLRWKHIECDTFTKREASAIIERLKKSEAE